MKYSFALPLLTLASRALAAPAVVYETEVDYVTGAPTTVTAPSPAPSATSSVVPKVDDVVQIVVSEIVIVSGDSTFTTYGTYTETPTQTATAAATAASSSAAAPAEIKPTTTLEQSTGSTQGPSTSTEAPATTQSPTTSTQAPSTTQVPTTSAQPTSTTQQTTTTSSSGPSATDDISAAFLKVHNDYRAEHGASALTWSSDLASYAQAYADKYDCSGDLVHSGGPYGENLGVGYTGTSAVDAWYNEVSDYDASNPVASHFTQVVWKSTTQLGCAIKTCSNIWRQYTICSYSPPGNVAGEYAANVQV